MSRCWRYLTSSPTKSWLSLSRALAGLSALPGAMVLVRTQGRTWYTGHIGNTCFTTRTLAVQVCVHTYLPACLPLTVPKDGHSRRTWEQEFPKYSNHESPFLLHLVNGQEFCIYFRIGYLHLKWSFATQTHTLHFIDVSHACTYSVTTSILKMCYVKYNLVYDNS